MIQKNVQMAGFWYPGPAKDYESDRMELSWAGPTHEPLISLRN